LEQRERKDKNKENEVGLKMDLKKSGGNFLSVNSFPPKLKRYLLDLSVLHALALSQECSY
jgi:hypothetical protein